MSLFSLHSTPYLNCNRIGFGLEAWLLLVFSVFWMWNRLESKIVNCDLDWRTERWTVFSLTEVGNGSWIFRCGEFQTYPFDDFFSTFLQDPIHYYCSGWLVVVFVDLNSIKHRALYTFLFKESLFSTSNNHPCPKEVLAQHISSSTWDFKMSSH